MESKSVSVILIMFLLVVTVALTVSVCYNFMANNKDKVTVQEQTSYQNNTKGDEAQAVTVNKGVHPVFDITKGKKVPANVKYTGDILFSNLGDSITIHSDGTVTVNYNDKEIKVVGLSGKIVDARVGVYGDGASAYMILLMEDGTVEKTNDFYDGANNGTLKSTGKIAGIENIVRIECVMSSRGVEDRTFKRATFIAIDADGYFYDLIDINN